MTCKPRQIIGSEPIAAIRKDYNRYGDKVVGDAAGIFTQSSPFAEFNPDTLGAALVLSNENLTATHPGANAWGNVRANKLFLTGNYQWEVEFPLFSTNKSLGLAPATVNKDAALNFGATGAIVYLATDGKVYNNGVATVYGDAYTIVRGVVFYRVDDGELYFALADVVQNGGDPVARTNPAATGIVAGTMYPVSECFNATDTFTIITDPALMTSTPRTGFTQGLPVTQFMFAFDDLAINPRGRYFLPGTGKQSGWNGSQYSFKVSGTTSLKITCDVAAPDATNPAVLTLNEDKGLASSFFLTGIGEVFTGERSHTFTLSDATEHMIHLKVHSFSTQQFNATVYKNILKSIQIDDGGSLTPWGREGIITGCIGDSWMGTTLDWPIQLPDTYNIYPVSFNGAWAQVLDERIDFLYLANSSINDPVMDIIIINSSVNDYNAGFTLNDFETYFASLVDKVRVQQPTATIFLLQSPDNTGIGSTYSQYGPRMSDIADARANVEYIPIAGIPALTWEDAFHLNLASRIILADFVDSAIQAILP